MIGIYIYNPYKRSPGAWENEQWESQLVYVHVLAVTYPDKSISVRLREELWGVGQDRYHDNKLNTVQDSINK